MKVRAGRLYSYTASGWDLYDRIPHAPRDGQVVRVIKLHGCPPPNTMGHCHVADAETGEFLSLVHTASLTPLKRSKAP